MYLSILQAFENTFLPYVQNCRDSEECSDSSSGSSETSADESVFSGQPNVFFKYFQRISKFWEQSSGESQLSPRNPNEVPPKQVQTSVVLKWESIPCIPRPRRPSDNYYEVAAVREHEPSFSPPIRTSSLPEVIWVNQLNQTDPTDPNVFAKFTTLNDERVFINADQDTIWINKDGEVIRNVPGKQSPQQRSRPPRVQTTGNKGPEEDTYQRADRSHSKTRKPSLLEFRKAHPYKVPGKTSVRKEKTRRISFGHGGHASLCTGFWWCFLIMRLSYTNINLPRYSWFLYS